MARDDAPPFARGETWFNDATRAAGALTDPLGLGGVNLEGKEFVFEPNSQDQASGGYSNSSSDPNGRPIRTKVCRNRSGVPLKPGRLVHFDESSTYKFETGTDGYTFALADRPAGVVDEFLPPAGVPANDLFHLVIDGPTVFTNKATHATLLRGSVVVPGVGTGLTNDDSGRVDLQDLTTGTQAIWVGNTLNRVGFIETANSTDNGLVNGVIHRYSK